MGCDQATVRAAARSLAEVQVIVASTTTSGWETGMQSGGQAKGITIDYWPRESPPEAPTELAGARSTDILGRLIFGTPLAKLSRFVSEFW